ncbi:HD-GYP domain-containing protein [Synechococcus sp. PCC 7336]|uniref:HD-GYP domain-containing protein n=1 Tax=Synechococcus sp. PCC 7336 TaxID=195250 RepID=UPI000364C1CF|nr:HD domain-containing phosphohydrolase [Synechococcus sp. PCC 7336]
MFALSRDDSREVGCILVADDRPFNRMAARDLLESVGHTVIEACDGREALEVVQEAQPDLVLLDVMMPSLDGFEVCRKLKARDNTRLIPVVLVTALNNRNSRVRGIEAGADDFLSKPYDRVELLARVRSLIRQKRLNDDLDNAAQVLIAIAQAVESRDPTTGNHCKRLAKLGQDFGTFLGLSQAELKALSWAGYLHDIGKIGIPDDILGKPGKHTPEEWAAMQSHVEIGERICSPLRTMKDVLPIIRHHHERWDGTGYPDNLVGEKIPLLARVFQMVDIYDALVSQRPYKKAFSVEKAIAILQEEAERGWRDPQLVQQFRQFLIDRGQLEPTAPAETVREAVPH